MYYILIVSHETPNTHTSDLTPHGKPLFLLHMCEIFYLFQPQYHPNCTVYISGNLSASQPTCISRLIIGRSLLPIFPFFIFSFTKFSAEEIVIPRSSFSPGVDYFMTCSRFSCIDLCRSIKQALTSHIWRFCCF